MYIPELDFCQLFEHLNEITIFESLTICFPEDGFLLKPLETICLYNQQIINQVKELDNMSKVLEFWPKRKTKQFKEKLVCRFESMVHILAKQAYRKLPSNYELDDLISCGMLGLLMAIERFDPNKGVLFKTFAEYRIRGAILDELRSLDWASRNLRSKIKAMDSVQNELRRDLGREASMKEVRQELKMEPTEFYSLMQKVQPLRQVSLMPSPVLSSHDKEMVKKLTANVDKNDPYSLVNKQDTQDWLLKNLDKLPKRQSTLMKMYYFENLTMREISKELNLTESRVSQLHHISLDWIKGKMEQGHLIAA